MWMFKQRYKCQKWWEEHNVIKYENRINASKIKKI